MQNSKLIVPIVGVTLVATLLLLSWFFRWEVIPTNNRETSQAYLLNRWTGEAHFLSGVQKFQVISKSLPTQPKELTDAEVFLKSK